MIRASWARSAVVGLALAGASDAAYAAYEWGFADVSVNRLHWDSRTRSKSTKRDFTYVEIEGGAKYGWGDLYGFFDLENPARGGQETRTAAKGIGRYELGRSKVYLYGHVYDFHAAGFSEQNRVIGLGYDVAGAWGWFKPFLGKHDVSQTYFSGGNGFMGGWVFAVPFALGGHLFSITDWHEIEFARDPAYSAVYGGKRTSQNGALAFSWIAAKAWTLGLQWRYAVDKLGTPGAMGAGIATVRWNL